MYLVTKVLADALRGSHLPGFSLSREVDISADQQVHNLAPDWHAPVVERLQLTGDAGSDDFGLTETVDLVVSAAALSLLKTHNIAHCDVSPLR